MEKPHIAVVPSAGFTHLVPILEFSKLLLHLHPQFQVTCLIPSVGTTPSSSKAYLQTLPPTIHSILLPPISTEHVAEDTPLAVQIELSVTLSLPYIKQELKSLCSRTTYVAALVVDVFAHDALDLAREHNLSSYIYLPQSAMMLSMYLNSTKIDEMLSKEHRDPQELIQLPGCVPLHSRDLPLPFHFRSSIVFRKLVQRAQKFHLVDGIIMNTFLELESGTLLLLLYYLHSYVFFLVA
ncbi:hypothetical protein RIF29_29920 [Crotalaria pallida]|uniref:Hydroquinone glucosyltransferase n=1 Tax=Crotalaria pallida TaxID=3830 RepID=A0AAN9EKK0_CROPI